MAEFIIRGEPDEDFGLHASRSAEALVPRGFSCDVPNGFGRTTFDLHVEGVLVSLSPEPVGWQVSIDDPPSAEWAARVAAAICERISQVSGQPGRVIPLQ